MNEKCYVCGGSEHAQTATHKFWPESQVHAELEREAQRHATNYSPESAYVARYRPY